MPKHPAFNIGPSNWHGKDVVGEALAGPRAD
jgi:hypothetical protein